MPFRNQSAGIFVTLFFLLDELNAFLQRHAREARRKHRSRRDGRIRSLPLAKSKGPVERSFDRFICTKEPCQGSGTK
jgi:hypothetical protein